MRRRQLPLVNPHLFTLAPGHAHLGEYELFSVAEQIVLRHKVSRGSKWPSDMSLWGNKQPPTNTLDSILFLHAASTSTRAAIEKGILFAQDSRMELLRTPIGYFEFRREQKEYMAFQYSAAEETRHGLRDAARALAKQYVETNTDAIDDDHVTKRFSKLVTDTVDSFDNSAGGGVLTAVRREELIQLCTALSGHLFRHGQRFGNGSAAPASDGTDTVVNGATRASLANWCRQYEAFSYAEPQGTVGLDAPNCYPYVAVEMLDPLPGTMFICAVTAVDGWFVDERVEADRRLPGITLAVYDVSESPHQTGSDRAALQDALRARIGATNARIAAYQRGLALNSASGEASNIGRYWFGEGVAKLLETAADAGGLETEDVLAFWSRFVKDLLCARIEGVRDTEVFPFDRAMVIRGAASNPITGEGVGEICILEAALRSTAADSRFEYLTSLERKADSLVDLDVSKKQIKLETRFVARPAGGRKVSMTLTSADAGTVGGAFDLGIDVSVGQSSQPREERMKVDKVLSALLGRYAAGDQQEAIEQAENEERAARLLFDVDGFLYEYRNGVDFDEEAPLLHRLDQAYKNFVTSSSTAVLKVIPGNLKRRMTNAKIVLISYDPSLIQENRRSARTGRRSHQHGPDRTTDYFVPPEDAFTLILIADSDPEKGVHAIAAERDDLRLLLTMILRQRMRDRQREARLLDRRINVIEAFVDNLVHRVGNEVNEEARNAIRQNWQDVQRAIRFERRSLQDFGPYDTAAEYLSLVWNRQRTAPSSEHQLAVELSRYVEGYLKKLDCDAAVHVRLAMPPIPRLGLRLPLSPVQECFDVLLKNAIEAAIDPRAPQEREIVISVIGHSVGRNAHWVLEVCVENTTPPVDPVTWQHLTSEQPEVQGKNTAKKRTTGVGVFAARHILRNGLGNDADILYEMMRPGRIQARIRLPATFKAPALSSPVVPHPASPIGTDAERCDILYVEDEASFLNEGASYLKAMKPEVQVLGVPSYAEALRSVESGLPSLLITDLSILETATSDHADANLGPKLIRRVMQLASERGVRPPIWIVSAADRGAAQRNFRGLRLFPEEHGYRYADEPLQAADLSQQGCIAILAGVKNLRQSGIVAQALGDLSVPASAQAAVPSALPAAAPSPRPAAPLVIEVPLQSSLRSAFERLDACPGAPEAYLIVSPAKSDRFADVLGTWFTAEGGRDPDARDDDALYPPWSSIAHRRVVLHLADATALALPLASRYWLVRHNVAVTNAVPSRLAELWSTLGNEPGGPISRFRHDARNIRLDGVPKGKFDEVEQVSQLIDGQLAMPASAEKLLEKVVDNPAREDFDALAALLSDVGDRDTDATAILRNLAQLDELLDEFCKHPGAPVKTVGRVGQLRRNLHSVQTLLFGAGGR